MFSGPDDLLKFVKDEGIQFIDVRFCDLPGVQQHFAVPAEAFDADTFEDGVPFDGSSVRGFQAINESDMKLIPDPSSAYVDPFRKAKTLVIIHSVVDPITNEPYSRDPRQVAAKAQAYLKSTGIADTAYFGAEAEFYVFDDVRYSTEPHESFYSVDSVEAVWNTGREEEGGNLGYKTRIKGGYFPVAPTDKAGDLRDDIMLKLEASGLTGERAHHEVGGAGQQEINYGFNTLQAAGDDLLKFKYIVKGEAQNYGKSATFMPKPIFGDNGSGMHCHQSLWKGGETLMYDENGYAGLSDLARWYIGGLIKHASSVIAFTNPTVNSYRRLIKGFEAPVNLVYSQRNRSAAIRIPITAGGRKAKRLEFRVPDPSGNPYMTFSAQLMAGLDGINNRIEPPEPTDKDLYELPPEELKSIKNVPDSLEEALAALEEDHDFLTVGDVFTQDLIDTWISLKREQELNVIRQRPTPSEFELYYDI
ncbi:type I glutamate--ammonia ligase [Propionibacterium sp.]|uniref:type I glutamate--ammonia ligase n=1 Tax=Propionibacterium sp. TaxID=1977903 RepID=UPI0039EAA600